MKKSKIVKPKSPEIAWENLLEIKRGFARSTNLESDYFEKNSLSHLVVSSKFQSALIRLGHPIADTHSKARVYVLSGTPGTGKSTFATFFSKLIAPKPFKLGGTNKAFSQFDKKEATAILSNLQKTNMLPVFLNGDQGDIEEAFFHALKRACEEHGLEDVLKSIDQASTKIAIKVIEKWRTDYPQKLSELENEVFKGSDVKSFTEFEQALRRGRREAFRVFRDSYTKVTGGASLGEFHHGQIINFYREVSSSIEKKGFSGIYVVYDEFGKYLERGVKRPTGFDLHFLQDFAEACANSGNNQLHLLLVTHLPISQYAVQLPVSIKQEWAKIEGRFEQFSFNDGSASSYSVLAAAFGSQEKPHAAQRRSTIIKDWLKAMKAVSSFQDLSKTTGIESYLNTCIPLHPSSFALLPLISERVAQNERTLFSFLTRKEEYSFHWLLERIPIATESWVRPLDLYRYFKPLMVSDMSIGGTCRIQIIVEQSLNQLPDSDKCAQDVLALLGLAAVINNRSILKTTIKDLTALLTGLYSAPEISRALSVMVSKKLTAFDSFKNEYLLFEGSSIDLSEEINKIRPNKLTSGDLVRILRKELEVGFVIPKRHNFKNGITRYFREELISIEDVSMTSKLDVDYEREDGRIYYVATFTNEEHKLATNIFKNIKLPNVLFVLGAQPLSIDLDLRELSAILQLYSNKDVISAGPVVRKELDFHKNNTINSISRSLEELRSHSAMKANGFYMGKALSFPLSGFSSISAAISKISDQEYISHPTWNSELINKRKVSGAVTQGRNKLLRAMDNIGDENWNIEGRGPEYSLYKTLNLANMITRTRDSKIVLGPNSALQELYQSFQDFIQSTTIAPVAFEELFAIWQKPPFGLRIPTASVYLKLFFKLIECEISVFLDGLIVPVINDSVFETILKQPHKYSVQGINVTKELRIYLSSVSKTFDAFSGTKARSKEDLRDSFTAAAESVYRLYKLIPDYAKNDIKRTPRQKRLLSAIDLLKQPSKFFLQTLPDIYEAGHGSTLTHKKLEAMLFELDQDLQEIVSSYRFLLKEVAGSLGSGILSLRKMLGDFGFSAPEKGAPLAKLWSETIKQFSDDLFKYPFSPVTQRFVNRAAQLGSDMSNQVVVENLTDALTGANPRNWSEKGSVLFAMNLQRALDEILTINIHLNSAGKASTSLAIKNSDTKVSLIPLVEDQVDIGTHRTALQSIKTTLGSLNLAQKNAVLINLLKEFNDLESAENSKITNKVQIGAAWG